jgi:hypothetical protein
MDDQAADIIADTVTPPTVEAPAAADVPMTVASVADLTRWRASCPVGSQFTYYAGPSLMRIRSRDVAADAVGKLALDLWRGGRVQLTQAKIGDGTYKYIATACEAGPVREPVVVQPVSRVRTKVVQV